MSVPAALHAALIAPPTLTIALSGGIDSLTLSAAAAEVRGRHAVTLCHAVSPAVPAAATARAQQFARDRDLTLRTIDAGEFADASYRANPVNRCYFCKNNLYGSLSKLGDHVAAGTNLDDLSDFRPGLMAAEEHGVLHPFVAAQMTKDDVRALARKLGLGDLAELPAAPCLASRIETGLRVEPADLAVIDAVEERLRKALGNVTLRCRRMQAGWLIELDAAVHDAMTQSQQGEVLALAKDLIPAHGKIGLRAYKRGSAFVHG
ncbi:adenine nucleotide alpha hydrolase [Sulfitobacter geojensis]|uniref:Adenine nucleotide alpha hydrolase n=1 Tax=Sulfitobacter geojensis TaxID=1342299 RepID=A0AAE2W086_9RHOB|nr:adenine nucleotide alpha hydrolase [Sulfitobacter geojensis]MBM1690768.1 adenine nucleotide alpha hydrolase [Sulfitobacter geojensis]MBM1694834.1 adenine nucleotide alpha hydrolase [Sulfitobacter geojensis]MBM1707012.1 adenine nucleotide alpha hydrolase [Sulfitobacter geojensis]MBM1711070.1 adenine nucleotide alpha hydrolase [Sulfitobacter geojensis]MBM1715136.1 adenine nucleotide alpha hydrolase [Sulfitobacter geojensis]